MQQPKYNIYPSLLDAFTWYKKSENPEAKLELVNRINRVPFQSDAVDKGTAFNELVDDFGVLKVDKTKPGIIKYAGFEFEENIINEFKKEVAGAIPQQKVEALIETQMGLVFIYGYADEILGDNCIDLKTTNKYEFPKFLHNWQHIVYPYCLNKMGIECNNFTYLITDFKDIYKEDYQFDGWNSIMKLNDALCEFIFFLETNKELITDTKIFGNQESIEIYNHNLGKGVVL